MDTSLRLAGGGGGGLPGGGGGPPGEATGETVAESDAVCVAHMLFGALTNRFTGDGPESDDPLISTEPSGSGPAHPAAATAPSAITCNVPNALRPRVIVVSPIFCAGAFVDCGLQSVNYFLCLREHLD